MTDITHPELRLRSPGATIIQSLQDFTLNDKIKNAGVFFSFFTFLSFLYVFACCSVVVHLLFACILKWPQNGICSIKNKVFSGSSGVRILLVL
jgi:hypothetical protein